MNGNYETLNCFPCLDQSIQTRGILRDFAKHGKLSDIPSAAITVTKYINKLTISVIGQ